MDEQIPLYAHEYVIVCDPQSGIQRIHSFFQAHSRLPLSLSYTLSFHLSILAQLGVERGIYDILPCGFHFLPSESEYPKSSESPRPSPLI